MRSRAGGLRKDLARADPSSGSDRSYALINENTRSFRRSLHLTRCCGRTSPELLLSRSTTVGESAQEQLELRRYRSLAGLFSLLTRGVSLFKPVGPLVQSFELCCSSSALATHVVDVAL